MPLTKNTRRKIVVATFLLAAIFFTFSFLKSQLAVSDNTADSGKRRSAESTVDTEQDFPHQEQGHLLLAIKENQDSLPDETLKAERKLKETNEKILLDVPLINQMEHPKLHNGCEVTSLSMMLAFKGIPVSKNELAAKIKRVPMKYGNGLRGNPNEGFVGDMEEGPGLGVYAGPVIDLARQYVGDRVEDLTGQPFDRLLDEVANGNPVWIISTTNFVPVANFKTWNTPQGAMEITFNMHSGVITGFDGHYIYVNNPYGMKNQRVEREKFIQAWEQMGSQAFVIY